MTRKKGGEKDTVEKLGRNLGRTSKYLTEYDDMAYRHCLLGATEEELAILFKVAQRTLDLWKKKHASFSRAINKGRDEADAHVASALYHRARGYTHPEDKIFNDGGTPMIVPTLKHYPPDATSIIFWLKNRQKEKWRDHTERDNRNINETTVKGELSLPGVEEAVANLLKKI